MSYVLKASRGMGMLSAVIFALSATLTPAEAIWKTSLPECGNEKVAKKVVKRFNKAETKLWHNGIEAASLSGAHEHAEKISYDSRINRRYCRASIAMSNGQKRRVYFVIEQGMGLAGLGWNVEYCLKGSDRWNAYGGWCRVLRK